MKPTIEVTVLGKPRFPSPIRRPVSDSLRLPEQIVRDPRASPPAEELLFELAGPRAELFFDPKQTRAGIVTCGGLCPGLNDVIRSLFLQLHHAYGVKEVLGFRGGYQGLDPAGGAEPIVLTPEFVDSIHQQGGTVLGTSRGPVDMGLAVDNLIKRGVNIVFTIGGDGTQRGGYALFQEAKKRGHALAVVGIPKTVDNDVAFVARTFGYLTAVEEAAFALKPEGHLRDQREVHVLARHRGASRNKAGVAAHQFHQRDPVVDAAGFGVSAVENLRGFLHGGEVAERPRHERDVVVHRLGNAHHGQGVTAFFRFLEQRVPAALRAVTADGEEDVDSALD